jgi:hypothetical protein
MKLAFDNACRLLNRVTCLVNGVLDVVSPDELRKVCSDETPEPQERDPSTGSGRDHRKAPRGRVHPMLVLMKLGVQAARLLKQLGGGRHPNVLNAMTLAEKMHAEAERNRIELEKETRKFTAAWAAMD